LTYPNFRLLVSDNGSTDDSIAAISARFPAVEQLANGQNLGFAAGANAGIRLAMAHGAEFVFLANNDTFIAPDALDLLVAAAQAAGAGLAAPAIYYADDPLRIWSVGGGRSRLTFEITGCRRGQLDHQPAAPPFEVDFVTACGLLIWRRCLETVGLFDERFFMYYEDSDYCLRARDASYRALVVPQAKMWHRVSISSGGSDSPNERYHMALSSVRFFRKHVQSWRWLIVAPYRLGSAVKTTARLLSAGQPGSARKYWQGLQHGVG
jgi:GT2 family glycosyltransferase